MIEVSQYMKKKKILRSHGTPDTLLHVFHPDCITLQCLTCAFTLVAPSRGSTQPAGEENFGNIRRQTHCRRLTAEHRATECPGNNLIVINFFYSAIPTVSLLMALYSIIVIRILLTFKLS